MRKEVYSHVNRQDVKENLEVKKVQLLIYQMMLKDCKRRITNLAMARLDYQKTYNMIPHSWIAECTKMFGIAGNIRTPVSSSMNNWKAKLIWSGK